MKILYIANEQSDAQAAATALSGIAPDVTVLWASHFDLAADWIQANRDLAALVVESQVDGQRCTPFLRHVRSLGLNAPVVVIVPEEAAPRLASLNAGDYAFVAKNHSLSGNLSVVVTRVIEHAQMRGETNRDRRDVRLPLDAAFERGAGGLEASLPQREASLAAERSAAAERLAAERLAAERLALERSAAERSAAERSAAERLAVERLAVERLAAERQAQLAWLLDRERETSADLQERLQHAGAAFQDVEERHRSAMTAAAEQLAERQAQYDIVTARAAATWDMVDEQLREAAREVERARQAQASAAAEVARLSRRESELSFLLAETAATHGALKGQLAVTETALEAANERASRDQLTAAERQIELQAQLERETEKRQRVEEYLARVSAERDEAEGRHASAMAAAAALLAERQALSDAKLTQGAAAQEVLVRQARDLEAALDAARQDGRAQTAATERLTQRESELTAVLAEANATRNALERRLAGTETAFKDADERATRERLAAARRAAEREAELDGLVGQERAGRAAVEQTLAQIEGALQAAEEQHASAMTAAAAELADRRRQFETELSETAAARDTLGRRLGDVEAEIERERQSRRSAAAQVERLSQREAELASQLAAAAANRATLEFRLAAAAAAIAEADEQAGRERLAAAERQADAERRLVLEITKREAREGELVETRAAAADAERWFREETAALSARARAQASLLEEQIARERLDQESRLAETREQLRGLALERDALDESLRAAQQESQRLDAEHREERGSLERARLAAEADVERLAAAHAEARRELEEARSDFQRTLDRASSDHAGELAALVASVNEREAEIAAQAARHSAALQAAATKSSQLVEGFQTALADRRREIEQLQGALAAKGQELDVTRSRRDALQTEADRVPQLQRDLDGSQDELRRQFEHSPLALCRCTRDGALTHLNRAFAALVGYRKADELRDAGFATAVFESPDDLFWLIERCLSTKATESVETTWRGGDRTRLVVRLSAFASASGAVEIAVEDLTNLRALNDRLAQAHRMEAVGRLASEVAVTCGNLLRDVHQNAQQWLRTAGDNPDLRHQGEMLLEEVTRAASFLRQLAAYSDDETSALDPVDLNRVVRDLEPVLKRVAGDEVEVELRKSSSPIDVDVKAERVERLLVNLAGYGRERMPLGGRLRIELASVIVNRRFLEQHPDVRQGPHALITVTEIRRAMRADDPPRQRDEPVDSASDRFASGKPGVDLGALQALVRGCGGHLWMTVEPHGDMVVKIHLPLRAADDRTQPLTSVIRSSGRTMARWFQH